MPPPCPDAHFSTLPQGDKSFLMAWRSRSSDDTLHEEPSIPILPFSHQPLTIQWTAHSQLLSVQAYAPNQS